MAQTHRAASAVERAGEATPELRALPGPPSRSWREGAGSVPGVPAFQRSSVPTCFAPAPPNRNARNAGTARNAGSSAGTIRTDPAGRLSRPECALVPQGASPLRLNGSRLPRPATPPLPRCGGAPWPVSPVGRCVSGRENRAWQDGLRHRGRPEPAEALAVDDRIHRDGCDRGPLPARLRHSAADRRVRPFSVLRVRPIEVRFRGEADIRAASQDRRLRAYVGRSASLPTFPGADITPVCISDRAGPESGH